MSYIEREAALLEIEEWADTFCECDYVWPHVIKSIRKLPAADVRPVKWGRWENTGSDVWKCSACGYGIMPWNAGVNFCPNCGADMRPEPPKEEI